MKEFWDERYSSTEYFYGEKANRFLASVHGLIPSGSKVLCIGEGEGRNAVFLAQQGFHVSAVDYSEKGKQKALNLADQEKVKIDYQISALEGFDFGENKWDAVVSIFCHLPSETRSMIHEKIEKCLKANGLFIIEAYTPEQLEYKTGGPKDVELLYTELIVRTDFKKMFWPRLERVLSEIYEGIGHKGMSSVLNGVGVKV